MNNIAVEQNLTLQCRVEKSTAVNISILINAPHYYLDFAFIIIKDNHYRMLVIKEDTVIFDKNYKSSRGAKIAFSKIFGSNRFKQDQTPQWSHRYPPDEYWLKGLLNLSNNVN